MEKGASEPTLYQKYLGISDTQIPPNHYTLLGIQPLESDPETIRKAAQKRADCLRKQKTDENISELQTLMNELAAARLCLLNDSRRKEYEDFINGQKASGVQMASPFASQSDSAQEAAASTPQTMNPTAFQQQAPQAVPQTMNPMAFQQQAPQAVPQTMDPMAFQQQIFQQQSVQTTLQTGQGEWQRQGVFPQQSVSSGMTQGVDFSAQAGSPLSMGNPNGVSEPFGPSSRTNLNSAPKVSRKKGQKKSVNSNSTIGLFCFGILVIITIALGFISWNSASSRANRLYIEAQAAVNCQNFDEGRRLAEQAIQLDKKDEYVRYRKDIDVKEKKYQKRLRHEKARAEEDEYYF